MSEHVTIAKAANGFRTKLTQHGVEDPMRDARLLIAHVAQLKPIDFISDPNRALTEAQYSEACALIERRIKGEPVFRIIGQRAFFDLNLNITAGTLEPRPDTEVLVEALIPELARIAQSRAARVLDLGTGTGAICLSLLSAVPNTSGIGTDISRDALATSLKNASMNGLAERYSAMESNWFANVEGCFDIIVSNPPYIRSADIAGLDVAVREYDPLAALDGGPDGLEPYRIIARECAAFLAKDGVIGVEYGYDQRNDVEAIFVKEGFCVMRSCIDYGGNERASLFELPK